MFEPQPEPVVDRSTDITVVLLAAPGAPAIDTVVRSTADALDKKSNDVSDVLHEISRPDAVVVLNPDRKNRDRDYICSHLVYEAFRKAEIAFRFNRNSISPDDIWQDGRVLMKFRIM